MSENSSDPSYLNKKFEEAKNRYRQTGSGGVTIETDKNKDTEPRKDNSDFEEAKKRFGKVKGNIVTTNNASINKNVSQSNIKIFPLSNKKGDT